MGQEIENSAIRFDFRKFGSLSIEGNSLKGILFSYQKPKQPVNQGNTIAGNPGEIKVEHPIDVSLDRISRVNVNEGVLLGPVIYVWDAMVVLAMILAFRFIGNCMPSFLAWMKS